MTFDLLLFPAAGLQGARLVSNLPQGRCTAPGVVTGGAEGAGAKTAHLPTGCGQRSKGGRLSLLPSQNAGPNRVGRWPGTQGKDGSLSPDEPGYTSESRKQGGRTEGRDPEPKGLLLRRYARGIPQGQSTSPGLPAWPLCDGAGPMGTPWWWSQDQMTREGASPA